MSGRDPSCLGSAATGSQDQACKAHSQVACRTDGSFLRQTNPQESGERRAELLRGGDEGSQSWQEDEHYRGSILLLWVRTWAQGVLTACTEGVTILLWHIQVSWEKEIYFKTLTRDGYEYPSPTQADFHYLTLIHRRGWGLTGTELSERHIAGRDAGPSSPGVRGGWHAWTSSYPYSR